YCEAPPAAGAPAKCFLLRESLQELPSLPGDAAHLIGELKNFNTAEEFRAFLSGAERAARITEAVQKLRKDIESGEALRKPALLRPLLLVSFADLKKYHFAYTVAFPVLVPPGGGWEQYASPCGAEAAGLGRAELSKLARALAGAGACLLLRGESDAWSVRPLADLANHDAEDEDKRIVAFVDPSTAEDVPGWPLRNLLLALGRHRPGRHRILAFRDPQLAGAGGGGYGAPATATAAVASTALTDPAPAECQLAGWSKIQNFDLTAFLDSKRVAADAVDLNIKLMKWRLLPELEPERMKELRVLILGSGTLGCGVARALMGWGVRRMTFVDSGKVSFSNPVRQSLFTHRDAAEGRSKAVAARDAVLAVMPDAEVEAIELDIPMPGHPHQSPEGLRAAIEKLKGLVSAHDVVCMLTDSRESRWLPSLLVSAAQTATPEASLCFCWCLVVGGWWLLLLLLFLCCFFCCCCCYCGWWLVVVVVAPDPTLPTKQAGNQASKQRSKQATKQASNQPQKPEFRPNSHFSIN
ncbi:unnamed protein product, partial [Polarella glacialis]